MQNPLADLKATLDALLRAAVAAAVADGSLPEAALPEYLIEIPGDSAHGELSSNLALASARAFRRPPALIAKAILAHLSLEGTLFAKAETAGPGFLNFYAAPEYFSKVLAAVNEAGERYGRTDYGKNEKVMVEFVSANPTGPMHMGNARGGAIGDSLAACLDAAGYDVTREFLVNDAGNQIDKFGLSLYTRYRQLYLGEEAVPFPEDGYHGDDIREHARAYAAEHGDALLTAPEAEARKALIAYALPKNIARMRADMERYRILFDVWFFESTMHENGELARAVQRLSERGCTYEKDGALWYKATAFGGEKDEVLIRANGFPTYFAADIAYHINKFEARGFSRVINVWGADHHGHVARLKGAMDAVGLSGDRLDIVLMQLVRLMKDGEPVRMSKRTGKAITLSDLLEEVPIDAARFFFNMREPGSAFDFDIGLAQEQTVQNPVYYVQYAHARISSILGNIAAEGCALRPVSEAELNLLQSPFERALITALASFPEEIVAAAKNYDPARITRFLTETATAFHRFYANCRCRCEDEPLMQARLSLCLATRTVLRNALSLMKIDAPAVM